jgi:endonuclease YncB( thermonuclease family)
VIRRLGLQSLLIATAIAALVPFLLGCGRNEQQLPKRENSVETKAAEVLDGDTFRTNNGKKVRIAGIDTPEAGEKFHDEAKAYLSSLIFEKEISIKPIPAGKDRYGRTLAEVFVDTTNVGIAMIKRGYAYLYLFGDDSYLKGKYLPFLIEAMKQKVGIWGLQPPKPETYYIRVKGSYRFHRPYCPSLKGANPKNLKRIKTRLECFEEGLSPCRNCRP